jgi:hypothetical protein
MYKTKSTLTSNDRKILNFMARYERSRRHTNIVKELNRKAQHGILPDNDEEVEPEPALLDEEDEEEIEVDEEEAEVEDVEEEPEEAPSTIESDVLEPPMRKKTEEALPHFPRLPIVQACVPLADVEPEWVLPRQCANFVPHPRRWLQCEGCNQLVRSDQVKPTYDVLTPTYWHTHCLEEMISKRHYLGARSG